MKRRTFLAATLAAAAAPAMTLAGGMTTVDYSDADPIGAALADGKTVFVDYAADWCSTCKAQERAINALRSGNPAYDENIVFVRVDWDDFASAAVTTERNIPRRSTLIVLKGDAELGRIVAGTGTDQIKGLLDTALAAATSSS